MSLISSPSNPTIKQARLLRQRKYREESGLFLVEGIHPVGEAAAAGGRFCSLETIFYAPETLRSDFALELVRQEALRGTVCLAVSPEVMTSLAEKEHPQGIVATARVQRCTLEELKPQSFPWGAALVAAQDPGNIGAILRTIDAVGASGLLLLDSSADPYHPGAVRASMGTIFWHPIVQATFTAFREWTVLHSYHVYGSSAHGNMIYRAPGSQHLIFQRPAILLLGSEQKGLAPEQLALCEQVMRLPMKGRASSLNLAVAAGILLYEMMEVPDDA